VWQTMQQITRQQAEILIENKEKSMYLNLS